MRYPTLTILLAAASFCSAETLTRGERDFAMSSMHATRKMFLDSVAGLTEAQWNFKASPERWSIAECAEHIAVSEDFIFGVAMQTLQSPAAPDKRQPFAEARKKDEGLIAMVPDRSQKFQAPEPLKPTNRFKTPAEMVAHFKEKRDANIDYIDKTQDDLRVHFSKHPAAGELDSYQWILLMSGHTERHTKQILEVKADPGYPK